MAQSHGKFGQGYPHDTCLNYNTSENNNSGRCFGNDNYNFGSWYQQEEGGSHTLPPNVLAAERYDMPLQFSVPPPQLPPQIETIENTNFNSMFSSCNTISCPQPYPYGQDVSYQYPAPSVDNTLNKQESAAISTYSNMSTFETNNSIVENNSWIINWSKNIGKLQHTNVSEKSNFDNISDIKIYEMRDKIINITTLLKKLQTLSKSLSITYKSLNDHEWLLRCSEIEDTKKKLDLLVPLKNTELLRVKQKINKRRKKRDRQKRKRDDYKNEKIINAIKKQQLDSSIDQWLEEMKERVERGRRDEEMKREADSVLAEVTRKKTEAKKQISLLSALLKLRQARVTAQMAIGINISLQQTEAFNNVIERLKSLWTKQLDGYLKEELALKVMLNEAVAQEKSSQTLKNRQIIVEWETLLFGSKSRSVQYQPSDIDSLVDVRKDWDQYVVDEGTVMSSNIPPGWIVPVAPSTSDWAKYSSQTFQDIIPV